MYPEKFGTGESTLSPITADQLLVSRHGCAFSLALHMQHPASVNHSKNSTSNPHMAREAMQLLLLLTAVHLNCRLSLRSRLRDALRCRTPRIFLLLDLLLFHPGANGPVALIRDYMFIARQATAGACTTTSRQPMACPLS